MTSAYHVNSFCVFSRTWLLTRVCYVPIIRHEFLNLNGQRSNHKFAVHYVNQLSTAHLLQHTLGVLCTRLFRQVLFKIIAVLFALSKLRAQKVFELWASVTEERNDRICWWIAPFRKENREIFIISAGTNIRTWNNTNYLLSGTLNSVILAETRLA